MVPSLKPNGLAHNTAVGDSLGHNVIALPSKEEPHGQPTSINDMLERGIDFNGAKYAKELRRRLRAMNSGNGVSKEEAEELVSSSLKAVQYTRTGASKGDLPDDGHAVTSVVSGTPTRRVPGLDKKKKSRSWKAWHARRCKFIVSRQNLFVSIKCALCSVISGQINKFMSKMYTKINFLGL